MKGTALTLTPIPYDDLMRRNDRTSLDFKALREGQEPPDEQIVADPGTVVVAQGNTAIAVVVGSSVVVTLYDNEQRRGGLCHFIRPLPIFKEHATPLFGLPACVALINQFLNSGSSPESLIAGIYGGGWPGWATARQREISRGNVEIARDVLRRKRIEIDDEDVFGRRGRKIVYMSGNNDIAIVKTDQVRRTDWFPHVSR